MLQSTGQDQWRSALTVRIVLFANSYLVAPQFEVIGACQYEFVYNVCMRARTGNLFNPKFLRA